MSRSRHRLFEFVDFAFDVALFLSPGPGYVGVAFALDVADAFAAALLG